MFISDHIAFDNIIVDKAWYIFYKGFHSEHIAEFITNCLVRHVLSVIEVNVNVNVVDNIKICVWTSNRKSYYTLFLEANKYEKTKMNKQLSDAYKVAKSIFKK